MKKAQEFTAEDKRYMKIAIRQAEKARGSTWPNPMVGAVIIKDGNLLSTGYHKKAGMPHAEIEAMNNSAVSVKDSTMYVTLEPCTVQGRTPPCVDALIKNRFKEVVIGAKDPNPSVNGKGIDALRKAGIKVSTGLFENEIIMQNEVFFKHIRTGLPFICAKIASTLDGKLATGSFDSKWITSAESRAQVQKIRAEYGCVLSGIGTIIKDDPGLYPKKAGGKPAEETAGNFYGNSPESFCRVILDSSLKIPLESRVVKTSSWCRTLIFCSKNNAGKITSRAGKIKKHGIPVIFTGESRKGKLDLKEILKYLYNECGVVSVLLESGPGLLTSFLNAGYIDKFIIFIAPKIIGGGQSLDMFRDLGIDKMNDSIKLDFKDIKRTGQDIMITAYPSGTNRHTWPLLSHAGF